MTENLLICLGIVLTCVVCVFSLQYFCPNTNDDNEIHQTCEKVFN